MGPMELARWQWADYARYHADRGNLLLHIVAVPLVLAGNLAVVAGILGGGFATVSVGVLATAAGLALQGRGHRREPVPSVPFTGPANALARLFVEQWVTFPRYVLSGRWGTALRGSRAD